MARALRIHIPGGYYHVMMRGNHGAAIFSSTSDYTHFLSLIQEGIERYQHRVHAFCLMPNHVHLLIQVQSIALADIIHNLAFRYTRYINQKNSMTGHLFQGRYKAILIDADPYLLQLIHYIHLNPVQGRICQSPQAYRWSSHLAYTGEQAMDWLHINDVLTRFSSQTNKAQKLYTAFMSQSIDPSIEATLRKGTHQHRILGSDHFAEQAFQISSQNLLLKPKLIDIIHAVCKNYQMNPDTIYTTSKAPPIPEAKAMAAIIIQDHTSWTLTSLATELNCSLTSLSQATKRLRNKFKSNQHLKAQLQNISTSIKKHRM
ncbi:MAG: transposase [Mariprofundaceae bacterium]